MSTAKWFPLKKPIASCSPASAISLRRKALTNELRLEEGYRFARSMRIPDGTTEIQKRTIGRRLLSGDLSL